MAMALRQLVRRLPAYAHTPCLGLAHTLAHTRPYREAPMLPQHEAAKRVELLHVLRLHALLLLAGDVARSPALGQARAAASDGHPLVRAAENARWSYDYDVIG